MALPRTALEEILTLNRSKGVFDLAAGHSDGRHDPFGIGAPDHFLLSVAVHNSTSFDAERRQARPMLSLLAEFKGLERKVCATPKLADPASAALMRAVRRCWPNS
jgi:hypothetical protein